MKIKLCFSLILFTILCASSFVSAQTTEFTYQGKLNDGATAANANYDFEFKLYDAGSGGALLGTRAVSGVLVSNGTFTVRLDFPAASFNGGERFLEIGVKPAGSAAGYTTLAPRQKITSAPYSIKSLTSENADVAANAARLGGVMANQFVQTNDSRLSDARNPLSGSDNYIQNNGTLGGQTASFNITGNGLIQGNSLIGGNLTVNGTAGANVFNATTQFNIGGNRVLSVPGTRNTFAGRQTGTVNTGADNSFFGFNAGNDNTSGADNSFFGSDAGGVNTTGVNNSFFGSDTGDANTTGSDNSFFGRSAGGSNTIGNLNSFFGVNSGLNNTSGIGNAFFGANSGSANTTGNNNSFFGRSAGTSNNSGTNNAFFGFAAGQFNTSGLNNSFFGANAGDSNTDGSNNAFFGKNAGQANTTGNVNAFFGVNSGSATTTGAWNTFLGYLSGSSNIIGSYNTFVGGQAGDSNTSGEYNSFFGQNAGRAHITGNGNTFVGQAAGFGQTTGTRNTLLGFNANVASSGLTHATAIGAEAVVSTSNTIVLGRTSDTVKVPGDTEFRGFVTIFTTSLNEQVLDVRGLTRINPASGGEVDICRNSSYQLSHCSSSGRYKENINDFTRGLELLRQLRPVTFDWKKSGQQDVGYIAEEVSKSEPLLATYNEDGTVEGVKYKQISIVLVNAVKEQQVQIEQQQKQIQQQQLIIDGLRKLVCQTNPQAEICGENK